MRHFSATKLPQPNSLGLLEVAYPNLTQVQADLWMHMQDFSYTTDDGRVFTAKAGTLTDLASIPKAGWNVLPPFGLYTPAAVIHDDLYRRQIVIKEEADHLFAEMMDCAGVPHDVRMILYDGVKFDGQAAWDRHAKELGK